MTGLPALQRYEVANVFFKYLRKCKEQLKDLLNNKIILNKLIKSSGKCNPKTKTYFSFVFHLSNSKSWKKYFL